MKTVLGVEFIETFRCPKTNSIVPAKHQGCGRYRFSWSDGKETHPYAIVRHHRQDIYLRCYNITLYEKYDEIRPNKGVICDALERGISQMRVVVTRPPRKGTTKDKYVGSYKIDLATIAFDLARRLVMNKGGDEQISIKLSEMEQV